MHSNNHQIFVKADSESPVYSATCTSEDFEDQNSTENSYSYGTSSENISLDEVLLDELPFLLETFSSDLVPESTDSLPSLSPTSDSASSSLDDNSISSDQNKHEPESQALLPDFKSSNTENSIPPDSSFADSTISFPFKLYFLMNKYSSSKDDSAIVSWSQNGLCFNINNSEKFSQDIIPIFFKQTKLSSFQRQLNLYGFKRLTKGKNRGYYFHPYFRRDKLGWIERIRRQPQASQLPRYEDVLKELKLVDEVKVSNKTPTHQAVSSVQNSSPVIQNQFSPINNVGINSQVSTNSDREIYNHQSLNLTYQVPDHPNIHMIAAHPSSIPSLQNTLPNPPHMTSQAPPPLITPTNVSYPDYNYPNYNTFNPSSSFSSYFNPTINFFTNAINPSMIGDAISSPPFSPLRKIPKSGNYFFDHNG